MNTRIWMFLPALLILVVGLSACGGSSGDTGQIEKITLAAYSGADSGLAYTASEQGFFADNGLEVLFKEYEAGKLAADALLAGEADIATSADFVLVSNSFDRGDLRVLGTVAVSDINELVARKDRGISEPSDLKGKKIGVTRKSVGEFFLGTFLTFNGLSIDDVEVVDLNPSGIVEAITTGDIDAGLSWNPNAFNMKKALGSNAISWPGQSGQGYYFILLSTDQFVNENALAIERFMKALVQAEEYVQANNEDAKEFVGRQFDYEDPYLESIWPTIDYVVGLPQALLVVMEDQARWRIESGLTDEPGVPNYLEFFYLDGLENVSPEAVTIIR